MKTLYWNGNIIIPRGLVHQGFVLVDESGTISMLGENKPEILEEIQEINLQGNILSPGFIDIHQHGGNGVNFETDYQSEKIKKHSDWLVKNGITAYLRSFCAGTNSELKELINNHRQSLSVQQDAAFCLGFHLEGPFLSYEKKGAFNPKWLHAPTLDELQDYLSASGGFVRQVTLAPELEGAFEAAAFLRSQGVTVALGHTNASYELASQALEGDFRHVTHTYNAMSSFSHRSPGAVGAVLLSSEVTAEVIADMIHVHPGAIKMLVQSVGVDQVVLVSDAMSAAGLQDGIYNLAGHRVKVINHTARLEDGTLAGSVSNMLDGVKNMVSVLGIGLVEAVNMASLNPARAIGLDHLTGSIEINKRADLVILDQSLQPLRTIVGGQTVFELNQEL